MESTEFEFEIIDEDQIQDTRNKKKPKLYFDGGTYLDHEPHFRDGWSEKDWNFYAMLVRMKVRRDNIRKRVTVLDDVVEFRMLPDNVASDLCDWLKSNDFKFVVYHD